MEKKKIVVALIFAVLALLVNPSLQASQDASAKPSVLIIPMAHRGWEKVDFPSMQRFAKDGLQMDYMNSFKELNWERIKKYNVLVFLNLTLISTQTPDKDLKKAMSLIDKFVGDGGGVFVIPDLDKWSDYIPLLRAMKKLFFPRYGAKYLFQQWISDRGVVTAGIWPRNKYAYTSNFASHPITKGLTGIWYPINSSGRRVASTTPIEVDKNWQVIVRGSETAYSTTPDKLGMKFKEWGVPEDIIARKGYKSAPPLMAVREIGNGRMAFMAMNSTFHLTGGSSCGLDGVTMEGKGINNIPNDLFKLFENTFRWLAEPSLKKGKLGGYVQKADRLREYRPKSYVRSIQDLTFPSEKPLNRNINLTELKRMAKAEGTTVEDLINRAKGELPSFKGLIGARSSLSTGTTSPEKLIAAARKAGLDYLVFLEDFTAMTPEKLEQLKKICTALSDSQFQAIPGFQIDDNRGHSQFYFGRKIVWPGKVYLTADGKRFDVSARPKTSGLPQITFMISDAQGKNALGYFNFKPNRDSAPMYDLKLYNSVGLLYYKNGKRREGLTDNFRDFLELNDQGTNPMPFSIDIVSDAGELGRAVKNHHFLTYVMADKVEKVMGALKYSYLVPPRVYISQGPVIRDWTCKNRDYTGVGENFITMNYRWRVRCRITSDKGLREVKIWDGPQLFRRYLLNGEKEFVKIFELTHNQQKNLILEVTDIEGKKAISAEQFDRNQLHYHYFCSDRINGAIGHGPYYFGIGSERGPKYAGKGIDTTSPSLGPPFRMHPYLESDKGKEGKPSFNNRPYQVLVSEDVIYFKVKCAKKYPESEKVWSVWGTYGPLIDTDLMEFEQEGISYRVGYAYWPLPETPNQPDKAWVAPSLFKGKVIFKKDMTVKELQLMGFSWPADMYKLPGNEVLLGVSHTEENVNVCAPYWNFFPDGKMNLGGPYTISQYGFLTLFSTKATGAGVIYNLSNPLKFLRWKHGTKLLAGLKGEKVKKGDSYTYEFLALVGQAPGRNSLQRYDEIRRYLGLTEDGKPGYRLNLKQGRILSTRGLLDLEAKDGVVDLSIPSPEKLQLHVILGLRIYGLNSRWSAGLYDRVKKKYRPIGTYQDIGYVRLNPETGESKDVIIGHPVIANNRDVFITFTHLNDKPNQYYCSVDNPTNRDLEVKIVQRMDLPGLKLGTKTVRIPAGSEVVLLRE